MELGMSLWHEEEPEGGTKPLGSMAVKGLESMVLVFFFLSSSFKEFDLVFTCCGSFPLVFCDSERAGEEEMRKKKRKTHKPKLLLKPMRAWVMLVMHFYNCISVWSKERRIVYEMRIPMRFSIDVWYLYEEKKGSQSTTLIHKGWLGHPTIS